MRLIVPGAAPAASTARPNLSLIKAVARGHAWYQKLLSGTASQAAIAKENGVDNTYVSRLVRCAFLAPDITAAILDGRQPPISHSTSCSTIFRRIGQTSGRPSALQKLSCQDKH